MAGTFKNSFSVVLITTLASCTTTSGDPNFTSWSNSLPKVNESLFNAENDPIIVGIGIGLLKLENGCIYFHQAVNPGFMEGIDDEGLRELRTQYGELRTEHGLTMTDEKFVVIWPEDTIINQKADIIELSRKTSPERIARLNVPIKLSGRSHSKSSLKQFKKFLNPSPKNFCNLSAPVVDPRAWDIFKLNQ